MPKLTLELHLLVLEGVSTEPNLFLPMVNGDLKGVFLVALSRFVSSDWDQLKLQYSVSSRLVLVFGHERQSEGTTRARARKLLPAGRSDARKEAKR